MSTRATYLFRNFDYTPDTCIYIHHDGYEEGAAHYMWQAFKICKGELTAEAFIRGNDRAELTRSHDAHGDTEYRYTFDGRDVNHCLHVEARHPGGEWKFVYLGDWIPFLNKHISREWDSDFSPLRRVSFGFYTNVPMTAEMARARIASNAATVGQWIINGVWSPEAANVQGLARENKELAAIDWTQGHKAAA